MRIERMWEPIACCRRDWPGTRGGSSCSLPAQPRPPASLLVPAASARQQAWNATEAFLRQHRPMVAILENLKEMMDEANPGELPD